MGAIFYFAELLPCPPNEAPKTKNPKRQLELFTHGGKLWLRMGDVNKRDFGENLRTVELTWRKAAELAEQLGSFSAKR